MDELLIEPANEHRQAFARWCLSQEPKIQSANGRGSYVPAALFASVPDDLLDGARIDGHFFRPVVEGKQPDGNGYADESVTDYNKDVPAVAVTAPRRTRARKGTQ